MTYAAMDADELAGPPRTNWRVIMARGRSRKVSAEYFRIDGGAVYFRNTQRGSYPTTVAVFAHLQWKEIINADIA